MSDSSNSNHGLFETSDNGRLGDTSKQPPKLGPPPDFTPYEADCFEVGYADIVSHDPHLNSDGEALYRFLLSQASSPPTTRISCRGTHTETRYRYVHGNSGSHQRRYTETVTDFDFCIDIYPNNPINPVQWSVPDDLPAYRGLMVRETETPSDTGRQVVKGQKLKSYKKWAVKRDGLGFPPWIGQLDVDMNVDSTVHISLEGLRSSKTVRQWADEYCASPKYLKEFVYEKVLYGWNMDQIEDAIRSTITNTPYNGDLEIEFTPYASKVYVRPNNTLSRMLSKTWFKILSMILLIYPFIWLYKRYNSHGGGRWEVCGAAYPLKQWVPLEPGEEVEEDPSPPYASSATTSRAPRRSPKYIQTSTGPQKLVGLKEGEWFRSWEDVIIRAVVGKYQSSTPIPSRDVADLPLRLLDGYDES